MREGKELILATKPYASENIALSWFYTLSTLLFLVLALIGTYWNVNFVGKLLCSILSALLMVRMFVIYHDNQHGAILNNSFLAEIIFTLFGLFILAPINIWKRSHDHHHKHNSKLINSTIGSYPTLSKQQFLKASKKERRIYLAARHPITILLGYITVFMLGLNFNSFINSPKKHMDSLLALLLHFFFAYLVTHFLGWQALVLSWILPFLISCGMGSYMFYCQHNFPGVKFKEGFDWTYHDAALESTSFMTMPKFMQWFTGNIGYHHIHHVNVRIPFYRLPEVSNNFPEFRNAVTTSWKIKDMIACFRLKLWVPEEGRMITLDEFSTQIMNYK